MSYAQNIWLYALLLFGIIVIPGMDMFFVIANSLTGGRLRGMMATAGIMLGGMVHTAFGAAGVSTLLKAFPAALNVVLVAGAGYMFWIGYTLLRSSIVVTSIASEGVRSGAVAFRQGLITCLLNPKAYLFVVAVYPQFIKPEYGPVLGQAMVMGTLTLLMQAMIYGGLGLVAAGSRAFLTQSPRFTVWIGRGAGALFMIAAAATLWNGIRS